jgi:hypothetical protein
VAVADLAQARPGRLDLLVVDAGADDASLAMSCPPAPFLQALTLPYTLPQSLPAAARRERACPQPVVKPSATCSCASRTC